MSLKEDLEKAIADAAKDGDLHIVHYTEPDSEAGRIANEFGNLRSEGYRIRVRGRDKIITVSKHGVKKAKPDPKPDPKPEIKIESVKPQEKKPQKTNSFSAFTRFSNFDKEPKTDQEEK
jgi:hypothetical protein